MRTLALFRNRTHLRVRVQTNLGFCATFATWDLLANTVQVKGRKKLITPETLAEKLENLKPIDWGLLNGQPDVRTPRIEFRDGAED